MGFRARVFFVRINGAVYVDDGSAAHKDNKKSRNE